jgi:hypothetical protein
VSESQARRVNKTRPRSRQGSSGADTRTETRVPPSPPFFAQLRVQV